MSEFAMRSPDLIRRLWWRVKHWRLYRSLRRAVVIVRSDKANSPQS